MGLIRRLGFYTIFLFVPFICFSREKKRVIVVQQTNAPPRIKFGAEKLINSLQKADYVVSTVNENSFPIKGIIIVLSEFNSPLYKKISAKWNLPPVNKPGNEGYAIRSFNNNNSIFIVGADPSGVLYGCLTLSETIKENKILPAHISIGDQPEMILRGTCIGLQKPYYLPGRN